MYPPFNRTHIDEPHQRLFPHHTPQGLCLCHQFRVVHLLSAPLASTLGICQFSSPDLMWRRQLQFQRTRGTMARLWNTRQWMRLHHPHVSLSSNLEGDWHSRMACMMMGRRPRDVGTITNILSLITSSVSWSQDRHRRRRLPLSFLNRRSPVRLRPPGFHLAHRRGGIHASRFRFLINDFNLSTFFPDTSMIQSGLPRLPSS